MTEILIADDNAQNLYLLETILKGRGYKVKSASNGVEALKLALEKRPDIIVTDILMPQMDGFEFCRRCKSDERLRDVPFIFYTATYTDLDDEQFALSLGADRFVVKPQQPEVLVQIIQEVLAMPRKDRIIPQKIIPQDEKKVLERYNSVLFHKLEQKISELEGALVKQKVVEDELRESEQKYRTLISQSPDGIFIADLKGNFRAVNRIMCESLKYREEELLSMSIWDIVPEKYVVLHQKRLAEILAGKAPNEAAEYIVKGKDGDLIYVEILSAPYFEGKQLVGFQGIARNITERKKAEETLRNSEQNLRSIFENNAQSISVVKNGKIIFGNPILEKATGYTVSELAGMDAFDLIHPDDRAMVVDYMVKRQRGEPVPAQYQLRFINKAGETRLLERRVSDITWEGERATLVMDSDITDRKKAEDQIIRSRELLQVVVDSTPDRIAVKDAQRRFLLVNKSLADAANLPPQDIVGKLDDEIWSQEQIYGNPEKGIRSIYGDDTAALSGKIVHGISNYTGSDNELMVYDTYRTPLRDSEGNIYGVLAYNRDITGLYKASENLKKSYEKVQKVLDETVAAIATICETRDPYTAGHQNRASQLACAIAREMDLSEEAVYCIKTGATLHDIGKLYVPAEILSKPGKLTDIEFAIIKNHPQVGYDIIKHIDFPSTVGKVLLQHHERLNGSGYPHGLTDGEIAIEAKIMAVADVVEAMSSHRPYRPTLGIKKALEEINGNKGVLYDARIVDICTGLFDKNRFIFA